MNADLLIHSIIQQTMVFTAQLATAGGVRTPLATLANQVFLDLASELRHQGLKHSVIADMFGITLRTYHRRVRELEQSRSVEGSTVWEAVFAFLRENEPVSAARVHQRFALDDQDVVAGVLSDLVSSGLTYGAGRGKGTVYRIADQADFGQDNGSERESACPSTFEVEDGSALVKGTARASCLDGLCQATCTASGCAFTDDGSATDECLQGTSCNWIDPLSGANVCRQPDGTCGGC